MHPLCASSKEATRRFAVQCELAAAVSRHADPHDSKQDGHAWHHGAIPALQDGLGSLSLKERAAVTTQEATTPTTRLHHCQGLRLRVSSVPPGCGSSRVFKEVTLVTRLSHPSECLAVRKEPCGNLHFFLKSVHMSTILYSHCL